MLRRENTVCQKLWQEIFIEYNGNVYPCSHRKTAILGNINENTLKDIVNNSVIRDLRKQSLNGSLPCYKNCTIRQNYHKRDNPYGTGEKFENELADYSRMEVLKIKYGLKCNISCIMCPQDHDEKVHNNIEALKKNIDLNNFKHIILQGGEALLYREAREYFDYAVSLGKKVSFLTNGLPIDEIWAEKIAKHSIFIHISINAATKETHEKINMGSKWEKVTGNISNIRKYRKIHGTNMEIIGHMTIIPENIMEIPIFIDKFEEIGFDTIQFGYDQEVPGFLENNPVIKNRLTKIIPESLISKDKKNVDLHRLKLLALI